MVVQASTKHQVVIPREAWLKLELLPKQRFLVEVEKGLLKFKPLPSSLDEVAGCATETFNKCGGGKKYFLKERARWYK